MKDINGYKYLTKAQLLIILESIPSNSRLYCHYITNNLLVTTDPNPSKEPDEIGYIDFSELGTFERI